MELKFFTNLIDALGKRDGGLKAIVNIPKAEREAIRQTLDETFRLIDTTFRKGKKVKGQVLDKKIRFKQKSGGCPLFTDANIQARLPIRN